MGDAPETPPSAPARLPNQPPPDIIRTTARAFELDRYLTALLAPRRIRADLVALAAFAGEIARIPAFVTEPMMGEIRLQWWRDAVTGIEGTAGVTGHPIADALAEAVRRHALPVRLLVSAIDAQSDRLADVPFASAAALSANIDRADGALFELACRIHASINAPLANRRAADPETSILTAAARAYGLARTLIEMPAALAGRRVHLPRDRLAAYGLTPHDLPEPHARAALAALTAEIARDARAALSQVRAAFSTAPRPEWMAILPVALVRPYLRVSELSDAPLSVRDILPISRITRLWLAARFGVF